MVWWKCDRGPDHEWRTTPGTRTRGIGCPCCGGRQLSVTNSLAAIAPAIADEWHPTRNGRLDPDHVVAGSAARAWWRCERGHERQTRIRSRTARGTTCRECYLLATRRVLRTSLAKVAPRVARELHPTKNGELTASTLRAGSRALVWWRCARNSRHQWQATVRSRTRAAAECPYCKPAARAGGGSPPAVRLARRRTVTSPKRPRSSAK
jgi:hypothetical protein